MLRTLKDMDVRSYAHQQDDKRSLRTDSGYSRHDLSVLCMFAERREKKKEKRKPLRDVIPYGTETDIHCSSGESYSSLKRKAAGSKQLLDSTLPHASSRWWPPSRALHQMQVFSASSSLVVTDPGECVAATVVAAALVVLPVGEELAVALGAWELVCPDAVAACKL